MGQSTWGVSARTNMKAVISLCLLSLFIPIQSLSTYDLIVARRACSMPLYRDRKINYCPRLMLRKEYWYKTSPECCCHPYRKTVMLPGDHPYLYNEECVRFGFPSVTGRFYV